MTTERILTRSSQMANHHFWRLYSSIRIKPELEWSKAQNVALSVDLEASAKQLLKFLQVIDRNRALYQGPALERAIYRYKNCWLPLLAKQSDLTNLGSPLVVPLDCEWIWHVHRLDPTRYKADCEELYGKILDNFNVVSNIQRTRHSLMEELWSSKFHGEPLELVLSRPLAKIGTISEANCQKSTNYDLISAVKRQSTFFYQVSRPFMSNDLFLKEAIARYKSFLHLIRRNKERTIKHFCVPTYDIDLIWHAHQLHPASYCNDTAEICGEVLEHDDKDSDRTEGKKLHIGFMETTKNWQELYGLRYRKAGTLHRGNAPSPLVVDCQPLQETYVKEIVRKGHKNFQLPKRTSTEILLEIVEVRGIPQGHEEEFFFLVTPRNENKDLEIEGKLKLGKVFNLQCEPTAELKLELVLGSNSNPADSEYSANIVGCTTISLADVINSEQELSTDRWFQLYPSPESSHTKPISVRICISCTPPVSAPFKLHLISSNQTYRQSYNTSLLDEAGNLIIGISKRSYGDSSERGQEFVGITAEGEEFMLATLIGRLWSVMDSLWEFQPYEQSGNVYYELVGERKVIFMPGKLLDYETKKNSKIDEDQSNFITAVQFSSEHPYGKAVALFDLKSSVLQIEEEWFIQPGTISYCILQEVWGSKLYKGVLSTDEKIDLIEPGSLGGFYYYLKHKAKLNETSGGHSDAFEGEGGTDIGEGGDGGDCGGSCGGGCGGGCGGCGG